MVNRFDNVTPLSVPRTHGHIHRHAEQWMVLIGDGSDADAVLSYFREMWPEVEGLDRAKAGLPVSPTREGTK